MKKIPGELVDSPITRMLSGTIVRLKRAVALGEASTKTPTTFSGSGLSPNDSEVLKISSTSAPTNPVMLLLKKTLKVQSNQRVTHVLQVTCLFNTKMHSGSL